MIARALAPRAGVFVALLACTGGCGSSASPLALQVRDRATGEPARRVLVIADVPNRNHPFSVASLLGQTRELSTRERTDDAGRVVLSFVPGRVVRLSVLEQGWGGGTVLIDPQTIEPGAWFAQEDPVAGDKLQPEFAIQPSTAR